MALPAFLRPAPTADSRPVDPRSEAGRYVRTFLIQRMIIGVLGLTLPAMLVFGDHYVLHGVFPHDPFPRDSESAYYWSGMRDWFVLTVASTGFFMIAYKITEKNLDNTISILGGLAAIVIPLFPTARTTFEITHGVPETPVQKTFGGEKAVEHVHFAAAAVFILALAGVIVLFGLRESGRLPHGSRWSPRFWRDYHFTCAGVVLVAFVWIVVTNHTGKPHWGLLAGETACALAFGASWFMKGFEIQYVLGRGRSLPGRRVPLSGRG